MALPELLLVAVVAEFATRPAEVKVASFEFAIAAELEISAFTISELVKKPVLLLWIIPGTPICANDMPPPLMFTTVLPDASTLMTSAVGMQNPVPKPPSKANDGVFEVPAGTVRLPVRVPPVNARSSEACPVRLAVIVPALKLPEPSRETMAPTVLALVAVVAELATSPEAVKVANLPLAIAAEPEMSASTINDEVKTPDALLCTTPAVENKGNATAVDEIVSPVTPLATALSTLVLPIAKPVLVPPVNRSEGDTPEPAGIVTVPDSVPPVKGRLSEANPVKLAVIVPAEKLPEASLATIALAVFALFAVVAELLTSPVDVNVASLLLLMAADPLMSASTISEDVKRPAELL